MGFLDNFFRKQIAEKAASMSTNYNRAVFRWLFQDQIIIKPEEFDYSQDAYAAVGAVYECVSLIIDKVIACPRLVYRVKDQKAYKTYLNLSKSPNTLAQSLIAKASALEEVTHPQITTLLNQPNPDENGDKVWGLAVALYLLKGNAFLYGNASPSNVKLSKWSEIFAFPNLLNIKSGGSTNPVESYYFGWDPENTYNKRQIKHLRTINPVYDSTASNLYGMPPLRPYLYSLDILKNGDQQADLQLKNGGKQGFISPKNKEDQLSTDQKKALKEQMQSARNSKDEISRIIPSSIPLEWTEVGLTSAEMELLEITNAKAEDIYRCYKIPLQFRNQDTATYNNLPMANRQLIYNAVAPICRMLGLDLTDFIAKPYNTQQETYVVELDYTYLPEMSDDMKTVAEALDKMWYLTPNEKREVHRWGRSTAAGMDEIVIPRNLVRLQDVMDGKIDHTANNMGERLEP